MEITQGQFHPEFKVQGPYGELTVHLVGRSTRDATARELWAKTRAFPGDTTSRVPELAASQKALPAPKMKGEDPANDKAYADWNRAYVKAARAELYAILDALVAAGHLVERPKTTFSRTAGCSCPCSPGFKLDTHLYHDGRIVNLHWS
jgi:hypothetical protein